MYLKITNTQENHHGLQYQDGLNIDPVPFVKEGSCCPGGIYFTTEKYICTFLYMGVYIREVTIPEDAEIVKDPQGDKWSPQGDKWRSSKVILGPRKELWNVDTWKWLEEIGADVRIDSTGTLLSDLDFVDGYLKVVKHLIENRKIIHIFNDDLLKKAAMNGQLGMVKYLFENGSDIHIDNDESLFLASRNGHIEVVKYIIEHGSYNDYNGNYCNPIDVALEWASVHGHLDIVKFLLENGAVAK